MPEWLRNPYKRKTRDDKYPTVITIAANTSDYNLATELAGAAQNKNIVVHIESGVIVSASSTSTTAFSTGSFPQKTKIKIINDGQIIGVGGKGGDGGGASAGVNCSFDPVENGFPGGNALDIQLDITIDNDNGDIFGGAGGGGGGHGCGGTFIQYIAGGGGGGGAGNSGGAKGGPGDGADCDATDDATAGSTTGGTGGTGCSSGGATGGNGGNGGEYGADGAAGNSATGCSGITCTPGTGGAAGKAIELNGNAVTFIEGNNASQVKGSVS